MSVFIITFADLGEKKNLKTPGIMPVINKFAQEGELDQIICRRAKNFYFKNTMPAITTPFLYILKFISKLSGFSTSRDRELFSVDKFASRKIQKTDVVFFHPEDSFPKSIRKSKQNNSVAVGIVTVAHPVTNSRIYDEEEETLEVDLNFKEIKVIFRQAESTVNSLDYIVAFSDFVKKTYIENGFPEEKIFVAYSDIDINKFNPQIKKKDKKFRVLYAAHTQPLKGLHYLLGAWTKADLKDAELVIFGNFVKLPEDLRQRYINIINSDSSIKWVGAKKDISEYYDQASVFVLPSLTEGNPKVIMEAMACGLPIITTENAKSIVKDGKSGFVVPIRDPDAIKEKIEFLYNNPDFAQKMGKEARRAMENKKPFGDAVFEIYEEILKRKGR